ATALALSLWILVLLTQEKGQAQTLQKHIRSREQSWVGYFTQTRLSNKFGIWADIHYRQTDNFVDRPYQFLFRPALIYYIKDNLRVNLGYALSEYFPAKGLHTTRPEHRPWQQIVWNQKYPGLTTTQWLRFEQRFVRKIADDELQKGSNYTF